MVVVVVADPQSVLGSLLGNRIEPIGVTLHVGAAGPLVGWDERVEHDLDAELLRGSEGVLDGWH